MSKKIPKTEYFYDEDAIKKMMYDFRDIPFTRTDCSSKCTITTFDIDGKPDHKFIYKRPYEDDDMKIAFFKAANLVSKLVKFWNEGRHENKELMDIILERRVFHKDNYVDFNLPQLEIPNYYIESNAKSLDLNNCYARVLYNNLLIDEELYLLLINQPKQVRLVTLGMLAKAFNHRGYNGAKCENGESIYCNRKTDYANIYFYAIEQTGIVMNTLKHILGDDYLFTWVDAIFFKGRASKKKIDEMHKTLTNRLACQVFDYKLESVPFMRYEKDPDGYQTLYLEKINSKTGMSEPKSYPFSPAWEKKNSLHIAQSR
jgi:hypothetical protein